MRSSASKDRPPERPNVMVLAEHVLAPDAEARLRRAYELILVALAKARGGKSWPSDKGESQVASNGGSPPVS